MLKLTYLITGLNTGGAEMQLYRVITHLDKKKFQPLVISMTDRGVVGQMLIDAGIPVYTLEMKRGIPDPRAVWKLYLLLRKERPTILNTHMYHANILGRIVGRMAGIPVLVSTIHSINFGGRAREIVSRYTEWMSDISTIISAVAAKRMIKDSIVPNYKLKVLPNGIDLQAFTPSSEARVRLRLEWGLAENTFLWIAVGRIERPKNYSNLLHAFSNVLKVSSSTRLFIVGDGPLRRSCEDLSRDLKLEKNVQFLGIRRDIPDLLNAADAYVMSSSWEGMPLVIMEAAATTLPVVSTDVGGVCELVVDDETGFLVNKDDAEALSEGMIRLMTLSQEERKAMGLAGRKHMEDHYSINVIVRQWEELYSQLLNKKGLCL